MLEDVWLYRGLQLSASPFYVGFSSLSRFFHLLGISHGAMVLRKWKLVLSLRWVLRLGLVLKLRLELRDVSIVSIVEHMDRLG